MAYTKPYNIDAGSGGDTVKEAIVDKADKNADQIVTDLNAHEALTITHSATGAIVGTTNAQTLTNKSLSDSTTYIVDETTATKKLQFSVGGNTAAVTGTIVTAFTTAKNVTLQDVEGTVYVSGGTDVPVTDGGTGASTASGARTNLGIGSGDSPTLTGLTLSGLAGSGTRFTQVDSNGTFAAGSTVADIPAGSKMLFYADTAPSGWTLDNTLDDKIVYITKGATAGGQTGGGAHSAGTWTTPNHTHTMGNHTHTGPSHTHTGPSHTHLGGLHTHTSTTTDSGGTEATGSHTLTIAEIPAHTHTTNILPSSPTGASASAGRPTYSVGQTTESTGGDGGHTHTGPSHSHSVSNATGAGGQVASGASGTDATGAGGTGASGAPSSNTSDGSATAATWRPAAYCFIVCSKN